MVTQFAYLCPCQLGGSDLLSGRSLPSFDPGHLHPGLPTQVDRGRGDFERWTGQGQ